MKKTVLVVLAGLLFINLRAQTELQQVEKLKNEAVQEVEKNAVLGQQINDMLFSFAELGFQEVETSAYLTSLLEKNGF